MYCSFSLESKCYPTGAMVARQTSNSPVWISYLKAVGSTPTLGSVSLFILFYFISSSYVWEGDAVQRLGLFSGAGFFSFFLHLIAFLMGVPGVNDAGGYS